MRKPTRATRLYRRWNKRAPERETTLPNVDTRVMVFLGRASELSYFSDKWTKGKVAEYVHRFRVPPLALSTQDGKAVLLVHAVPKRFVTARGLVS